MDSEAEDQDTVAECTANQVVPPSVPSSIGDNTPPGVSATVADEDGGVESDSEQREGEVYAEAETNALECAAEKTGEEVNIGGVAEEILAGERTERIGWDALESKLGGCNIEAKGEKKATVIGLVVEFHVREGPALEMVHPEKHLPFLGNGLEGAEIDAHIVNRLAFLALPDRSDAADDGFCYFVLQQAPDLIVGVSCFRQIESEEATRNKSQRAVCILSRIPAFSFLRRLIEERVSQVAWAKSIIERREALGSLCSLIETELDSLHSLSFGDICGNGALVSAIRAFGSVKPILSMVRCILLGNAGVVLSGPSGSVVSEILIVIASLLPEFGGMLGHLSPALSSDAEVVESSLAKRKCWSKKTTNLVHTAMAVQILPNDSAEDVGQESPSGFRPKRRGKVRMVGFNDPSCSSKMLLMPYCSLIDVDELEAVCLPRKLTKSSKHELQGRCGFLVGCVNPIISARVKRGLGDLSLELQEVGDLDETFSNKRSSPPNVRVGKEGPNITRDSKVNSMQSEEPMKTEVGKGKRSDTGVKEGSVGGKSGNMFGGLDFRIPAVQLQFQQFSTKAAQFMKEKTDEVVTKFQKWNVKPVVVDTLSHAGKVSAELGGRDKDFAKTIDRMVYHRYKPLHGITGLMTPPRSLSPAPGQSSLGTTQSEKGKINFGKSTQDRNQEQVQTTEARSSGLSDKCKVPKSEGLPKSFSSFFSSIVSHVVDPLAEVGKAAENAVREKDAEIGVSRELGKLVTRFSGEKEEIVLDSEVREALEKNVSELEFDVEIRSILVDWMNNLFEELDKYTQEVVISQMKFKHNLFQAKHTRSYLQEWTSRTESTRERKSSSEIVGFKNGDEYRGELVISDADGFVDLFLSASDLDKERRLCRHGMGVYVSRSGSERWRYEGMWADDLRHGEGMLTLVDQPDVYLFDGNWVEDRRCGQGTCTVRGKGQYSGMWKNDEFHGQGTLFDSDGACFRGVWKDGLRHGEGCWTDKDGLSSFEGEWSLDRPHGVGNAFYGEDGSKYCGMWKDGQRSEQGVWSRNGLEWYEGSWKSDMRDGKGTLVFTVKHPGKAEESRLELEGFWKQDCLDMLFEEFVVRELPSNTVLFIGRINEYFSAGGYHLPSWAKDGELPKLAPSFGCCSKDFASSFKALPTKQGTVTSAQTVSEICDTDDTDVEDNE